MAFTWDAPEAPQRGGTTPAAGAQQPPPQSPGPYASGYVPYYPDPDPKTPGNQNPDMPIVPTTPGFLSTGPADGDYQKWFQTLVGGRPSSYALIKQLEPQLTAAGIQISTNKEGDPSKLILPNGHYISAVDQNGAWRWMDQGTPADNQGQGGANALGSLIAPFTEQFTNPAYVAPTGVNDGNDPGFSSRMNAADDALQRSAAAKGSLLSGSTLKALSDWNSDYASSEYANVDSRARQTYATNSNNAYQQYAQRRANFYQNQDSPFAKLFGLAQLDSSNQNALNNTNLGYAQLGASTLQNPSYANYLTQGANANAAGQVAAGNAYSGLFGNLGNTATLGYLATRRPTYPQMGFGY